MAGLWKETLDACEEKLQLARAIRESGGDIERALVLIQEARDEAEVIRTWASMTRFLMEAQREAREIR